MENINLILKRTFDIATSILALLILLPLFLILSFVIKFDSKGTIFYKQERIGKNGKIFTMYKLRSMVIDAEKIGTGLFNYKDDPRVTKVGRFLRESSLDELPQLFNVLIGKMSLVGPRPAVTYELGDFETLNRSYKKRFDVLPGITGYAQVMGRNNCGWDQKVNYDIEYIELFKKQGIFIDIKILFLTVLNVFRSKDIYEVKIEGIDDDLVSATTVEAEIIRKAHEPDGVDNLANTNAVT